MTGLNHATTGIVIAILTKRPEIAVPLAFISHFVLDSIPHSFVPLRKNVMATYITIETIACTTITLICMVAFPDISILIGICALVAFSPDFLWPFYYNGGLKNKPIFKQFYAFHKRIQWSETYRGWLVELLYFSVLLIFLTTYKA